MPHIASFLFLAALLAGPASAQQPTRPYKLAGGAERDLLPPGTHWQLLGEGYHLTGDSAVDSHGNVYFTDVDRNRILKIGLDGNITTWRQGTNGAHGVAFGPDGRLYAGQHDLKRIVAFSTGGAETVIAEGVQSHHLAVTSRNRVYVNVPPAHSVWLIDSDRSKHVVHDRLNWPRGVRASADESRLVVNHPPTRLVWSFRIEPDGSLSNGRPFYRLETPTNADNPDPGGMAFDTEDFLYVATTLGVQVFDPAGRAVAILKAPGGAPSNVLFGGRNLEWLYVTDGNRMYRRPTKRRGAGPWKPAPVPR